MHCGNEVPLFISEVMSESASQSERHFAFACRAPNLHSHRIALVLYQTELKVEDTESADAEPQGDPTAPAPAAPAVSANGSGGGSSGMARSGDPLPQ